MELDFLQPNMSLPEVNAISALGLAHMGDGVFELLVRTELCAAGNTTARVLHRETVRRVSAPAQAERMDRMLPLLSEEEAAFYKRGRNTQVHGVPKNASPGDYGKATGLECLFGALWLLGRKERILELFHATDIPAEADHAL